MASGDLIEQLTQALRCLPGVGPKSAQRMTYHLLERDRDGGRRLAGVLSRAMDAVGHCKQCGTFTEDEVCAVCRSPSRDRSALCIVEYPADLAAVEHNTDYRGLYIVLMGNLSPLDGVGPRELGLDALARRLDEGEVREMIVATSFTVEGEATAHYLGEMAKERTIRVTRLAQGVPVGGELEFVNGTTIAHAFGLRREL
ncbi:MAG: recombination mediator RecR [Gammaproteobacteria bacterium]|nr:recombination mediator RecR [Gammaproteobacteria bacterium]